MTDTTYPRSCTRLWGDILSGEPPGLVCEPACEPRSHANVGSRNQENIETIKTSESEPTQTQNRNDGEGKNKSLGIIQINLHKSKAATTLLSHTLQNKKDTTQIALVTEPHTRGKKVPNSNSKGYLTVTPTSYENPRACIMIQNTLNHMQIPQLNSRDTVAILVDTSTITGKKQTIFASVYQPPEHDNQPPTPELRKIIKYAKEQQKPLIIGCDTNGHHQMWGSKNNNKRGRNLAEYITTADLITVNEGQTPTFQSANGETIIDVTIASKNIENKISNWQVLGEESLSDHRYITFEISTKTETHAPKHNPRHTDWNKFRTIIRNTIPVTNTYPTSTNQIEIEVTELTNTLRQAFEKATPLPKQKPNRITNAPWWTKELGILRNKTNKAHRKHGRTHEPVDWQKWRQLKLQYESTIRREKRRGWRNYTTGINKLHDAQKLTKVLDKGQSPKMSLLTRPDDTVTQTTEETLQHLTDTHFPGNKPIEQHNETTTERASTHDWIEAKNTITPDKVEWAIHEFQPYKSPGYDNIFPITLQKSIDILKPNITNILTSCIAHGYVPKAWRISKVIFIPKPGKETYDSAKSYRPISLTSFLLKTLEKILDRDLRDTTLSTAPIHTNQHAYQTGKSTESALHQLVSKVETAIDNKEYALGTFFDISGAFDNAPAKVIIQALKKRDAKKTTTCWIEKLLRTRIVSTANGLTELKVRAMKGCPQGGVLSPLLWCLVVDEMLNKLNREDIYTQAYSDDGTILITGKNLTDVCLKTQKGITMANEWCKNNGLSIHPDKTDMVLFTRKRKTDGWITPKLDNKQLKLSTEVKYLGVILDKKLSYNSHITEKCKKVGRIYYQAKKAISKSWGLSPHITKWLYITVIRPMFSYAAILWWEKATHINKQKRLASAQRTVTLGITGAMKTTPSIALDCVTELAPLHIHIITEAMKTYIRMKANGTWKNGTYEGHRAIEIYTGNITKTRPEDVDLAASNYTFTRKFKIDDTQASTHNPDKPDTDIYYITSTQTIDEGIATKLTQPRGGKNITYQHGKNTSKTISEIHTIIKLCEIIQEKKGITKETLLICGNQGTLIELQKIKTNSKTTTECIKHLNKLAERTHITIQLKSSDTNEAENNTNENQTQDDTTRRPYTNIVKLIDQWSQEQHTREFAAFKGGIRTKENMGRPYTKRLSKTQKMKREDIRIITQILTGHAWLRKHLHTMKLVNSPDCQQCNNGIEDVDHFMYECAEQKETRERIFGGTITKNSLPIKNMALKDILTYCKTTKRVCFEPDEIE